MKFLASAFLAFVFVPVESTLAQESTQDHPTADKAHHHHARGHFRVI
jgi:hypothetical protein